MSAPAPEPSAVEFGPADDGPAPSERSRGGRIVAAVLADPRLVVVLGGLAGVAAFASMVGEWFVANLPQQVFDDVTEIRTGVNGAGVLGGAYLFGVLLLAALVMLVVAGPAAARRAVATAGLGVAGVVLALLVAVRLTTRAFYQPSIMIIPANDLTITFGRGFTLAFLVPILAGTAFVLARRLAPAPTESAAPRFRGEDFLWRRPRRASVDPAAELAEPPPLDLTVGPARPFAHPDPSTER